MSDFVLIVRCCERQRFIRSQILCLCFKIQVLSSLTDLASTLKIKKDAPSQVSTAPIRSLAKCAKENPCAKEDTTCSGFWFALNHSRAAQEILTSQKLLLNFKPV
jgi:hypothetical protein